MAEWEWDGMPGRATKVSLSLRGSKVYQENSRHLKECWKLVNTLGLQVSCYQRKS